MNKKFLFAQAAFALGLVATVATAVIADGLAGTPVFDLSWHTVDGGGGTSAGGTLAVSGTVGQPDAGVAMTGGGFAIEGGFWPGDNSLPLDTCLADIVPLPAGNSLVNVDDLLAVINAWGVCGNPNNCPADIAPPGPPPGNDVVNVDDLLAVINGWGMCP